jgi:hypothetical protein
MAPIDNLQSTFIKAACVPLDGSHASGTLEEARAILTTHPDVAGADIYTAAILGHDAAVRRFLDRDPNCARAKGGPFDWDRSAICGAALAVPGATFPTIRPQFARRSAPDHASGVGDPAPVCRDCRLAEASRRDLNY